MLRPPVFMLTPLAVMRNLLSFTVALKRTSRRSIKRAISWFLIPQATSLTLCEAVVARQPLLRSNRALLWN